MPNTGKQSLIIIRAQSKLNSANKMQTWKNYRSRIPIVILLDPIFASRLTACALRILLLKCTIHITFINFLKYDQDRIEFGMQVAEMDFVSKFMFRSQKGGMAGSRDLFLTR